MKSVILAAVAATLLAVPAYAATVSSSVAYQENKSGGATKYVTVSVGDIAVPASPLKLDVVVKDEFARKNLSSTQEVQAGLTTKVIGPVYARAGLGYGADEFNFRYIVKGGKLVLNPDANDFVFYNGTIGANVPVTKKISVDVSETYQDSLEKNAGFQTWNTTVGASYAVTKNISVRAFVAREEGSTQDNQFGTSLAVKF
jgi:opacity protein-like surface antigen